MQQMLVLYSHTAQMRLKWKMLYDNTHQKKIPHWAKKVMNIEIYLFSRPESEPHLGPYLTGLASMMKSLIGLH